MRLLAHGLKNLLIFLAAIFFIIEEWLWDRLTLLTAWLGKLPVLRQLEQQIAKLPPYGAMAILIVPAALLFPFKLMALYVIAHGHAVLGVLVILAAKITGTAIVARLFTLCRPQMLSVPWFAALYHWIISTKTMLYAKLQVMPTWIATREAVLRLQRALSGYFKTRNSGFSSRRWQALKRLLKNRRARGNL